MALDERRHKTIETIDNGEEKKKKWTSIRRYLLLKLATVHLLDDATR